MRFGDDADTGARRLARRLARVRYEASLPVAGMELVRPVAGISAREALAALERSSDVLYAEPDALRVGASIPSDPLFDSQWGLHNIGQEVNGRIGRAEADIDAPEAWDLTTGRAVAVGVVDSGVELDHPDLARSLRGDGWDWVENDSLPADANGHGTHVAGTIGARGNDGIGVTGVAPNATIVPLRVLGADGTGRVSDVIRAYSYAARSGIRVVNASLTGAELSMAEQDAIVAAPDTLFVVAAGNDGADNGTTGSYPCNYPLINIVCVAATDQLDRLASFSNHGAVSVDLGAPGTSALSSYRDSWAYMQGTSMATPHVAGTAALVWSLRPRSTVADVRASLLGTVDVQPALVGRVATGGRLNAYRALTGLVPPTLPVPTAPPDAAGSGQGRVAHRPRAFRVRRGVIRRGMGARSRLYRNDGRRLELVARRSRRCFVTDGVATVRIARVRRRTLDRLELSFDGGTTSRRAVVRLRVYDWARRRWRTVARVRRAGRRDRSARWSVAFRARRYVSRRGAVRISLRATAPTRFRARADLIGVATGSR